VTAGNRDSGGRARARRPVEAVVLDLDGVLIEGEEVWDAVREQLVRERGGHWTAGAQAAMMGMSSPEWSGFMARELQVPMEPAAISSETVARVAARYAEALPLVDGAVEVVRELAQHWPLGLASSANRPIIELVLDRSGLTGCFRTTVSSEEVARGKPAPRRLPGSDRSAGHAAGTLRRGRGLYQRPAIGRGGPGCGWWPFPTGATRHLLRWCRRRTWS
jgi:phosphoglycolate phosphatase-like HAD superfamily hydrolase